MMWGNCLKCLKSGWNRNKGRGNKYFKKGGKLGQGSGSLKKGGPPYELSLVYHFQALNRNSMEYSIEFTIVMGNAWLGTVKHDWRSIVWH